MQQSDKGSTLKQTLREMSEWSIRWVRRQRSWRAPKPDKYKTKDRATIRKAG